MRTKAPRQGGSFAPPLTDKKLGEIETMIGKSPSRRNQSLMKTLFAAVARWWEIPEESSGPKRAHASGVGSIIDLHPDVKAKVDDLLPWDDELKSAKTLLEQEEAITADDRAQRLEAWRKTVDDMLWQSMVSPLADQQKLLNAVSLYRSNPHVKNMLTPSQIDQIEENARKVEAWMQVRIEYRRDARKATITRPGVEETPIRNAGHTLLWHAVELSIGREPITTDKL
jgi:hypothetical protein